MKKIKNEKGFTLAELLIVVAIIAVLVAVSIPIFTAQLEKSREATDLANLRAAKAEATACYLTDEAPLVTITDGVKSYVTCYYDAANGVLTTDKSKATKGKGTDTAPGTYTDNDFAVYNYDGGKVTDKIITITVTTSGTTETLNVGFAAAA